jgi:glutathione S-transferase
MKLYDSGRAPNPRRVRIFLAEKGISVPAEQVDLGAMEQKSEAFTALNPLQRVPVLALDDGTVIAESVAICRYFERLRPEPPLFGRGPKEEALVEMWNRRLDHNLLAAVSNVFRHSHPAMKDLEVPQVADWAEANRPRVLEFLAILDAELQNQLYVVGDHFTIADITGLVAIDFMKPARLTVPDEFVNVRRWHAQVSARPSAKA